MQGIEISNFLREFKENICIIPLNNPESVARQKGERHEPGN
jgi:hypothetical protein